MKIIQYALLLLALGLPATAPAQYYTSPCQNGQCPPTVEPTRPATFADLKVVVDDKDGGSSHGSAVPVQRYDSGILVATNAHVVSERRSDSSVTVYHPSYGKISGVVREVDEQSDVAIVYIPVAWPVVNLAPSVAVGARVTFRGWASGRTLVVRSGTIRGSTNSGALIITAPSQSGMSGGGVYQNNQLVGVIWGTTGGESYMAPIGPIRAAIRRLVGARTYQQVPIVQAAPVVSLPSRPGQQATQQSCDCNQRLTQLEANQERILGLIESMQQTPGPPGPPGEQGPEGPQGPPGKDADTAALQSRLANMERELAALQEKKIQLEIYSDGELVGVSEGRSVVGFDIQSVLKEKQDGSK